MVFLCPTTEICMYCAQGHVGKLPNFCPNLPIFLKILKELKTY